MAQGTLGFGKAFYISDEQRLRTWEMGYNTFELIQVVVIIDALHKIFVFIHFG